MLLTEDKINIFINYEITCANKKFEIRSVRKRKNDGNLIGMKSLRLTLIFGFLS